MEERVNILSHCTNAVRFYILCIFLLRPLHNISVQMPDQWMNSESEMQFLSASSLLPVRSGAGSGLHRNTKIQFWKRTPHVTQFSSLSRICPDRPWNMLLKLFSKRESATPLAHCRVSPLLSENILISSMVPLACSQSTTEDSQWQFSLQCLVAIRLLLFITYAFNSDHFFF